MAKKATAAARNIVLMPLEEVKPAARNPKAHDIASLVASIKRFGFADAVILDERTGRLVSGHGRVEALAKMQADGAPPPEGVRVEGGKWLVPVQRGWASKDDREAEAFLVAANRLVEAGGWDEAQLEALLRDIARESSLDGLGLDSDDVERLVRETDASADVEERPVDIWQVLVDVESEAQQRELLEELTRRGFKCRPLMF
jgi:ParB-like chromosome segregation protein Spo0J